MSSLNNQRHQKLDVKEAGYDEVDIISTLQEKIMFEISCRCNYDCYWYDCGDCDDACSRDLDVSLQPLVKQIQVLDSYVTEDYLKNNRSNTLK